MPLSYQQTGPPTLEPVTLDELKAHLHVIGSDEDRELQLFLVAARTDIERHLHRQLMAATYVLYLDAFPVRIRLPHSPVQSITSIQYLDTGGSLQVLDTSVYQTDLISEPSRILVAEGKSWPSVQSGTVNTVQVTYVAGYAGADTVPEPIKLAIKMHAGDLYAHRESQVDRMREVAAIEMNPTYQRLLARYLIPVVG